MRKFLRFSLFALFPLFLTACQTTPVSPQAEFKQLEEWDKRATMLTEQNAVGDEPDIAQLTAYHQAVVEIEKDLSQLKFKHPDIIKLHQEQLHTIRGSMLLLSKSLEAMKNPATADPGYFQWLSEGLEEQGEKYNTLYREMYLRYHTE